MPWTSMFHNRKSVHDIRAQFETRGNTPRPILPPFEPQQSPTLQRLNSLTDMSASPRRILTAARSIDAILDTLPAVPSSAPSFSRRPNHTPAPAWIGPRPAEPRSPRAAAMKVPVDIEFSSPGLQPPVFICTSLSEPPWEPIEMDIYRHSSGEYLFSRSFNVEEGEYQYKLRLGPGDWWACDESKPTIDDDAGNKNNLLIVKSPAAHDAIPDPEEDLGIAAELTRTDSMNFAPLLKHETFAISSQPSDSDAGNEPRNLFDEFSDQDSDVSDEAPPLLSHEATFPVDDEPYHVHFKGVVMTEKSPSSVTRSLSPAAVPEEADPLDPSLEPFPTDQLGIINLIRRASIGLPEDPSLSSSSTVPRVSSRDTMQSGSLYSVNEEDDDDIPDDDTSASDNEASAVMIESYHKLHSLEHANEAQTAAQVPLAEPPAQTRLDGGGDTDAFTNKGAHANPIHSHESSMSAIYLGFGLVVAAAATAFGLWLMRPRS